jgi:ribosome-associated protein
MTDGTFIKLDSFLKWQGLIETGGQAKVAIQNGEVKVNGAVETRRGRKLVNGDRVAFKGKTLIVKL